MTGALPLDGESAEHKGSYLDMTFCIVIFILFIFKFSFYDMSLKYCSQENEGIGRIDEARLATWWSSFKLGDGSGSSLHYSLCFYECLNFFHYKDLIVSLFASLEKKKRCYVLNVKMCKLPCYNKTKCVHRDFDDSLRTYYTSDLPGLVHLINILSTSASLNLALCTLQGHMDWSNTTSQSV